MGQEGKREAKMEEDEKEKEDKERELCFCSI